MEDKTILEGEIKKIKGTKLDPSIALCFGEYNKWPECPTCVFRKKCKRFTEAEKVVTIRYQGKYGHRGKEKRKDKY